MSPTLDSRTCSARAARARVRVGVAEAGRGGPDREGLQREPGLVRVAQVLHRQLADPGALVRHDLDQPERLHPAESLADRHLAHVQPLGELLQPQRRTARELAGQDELVQFGGGFLRQRAPAARSPGRELESSGHGVWVTSLHHSAHVLERPRQSGVCEVTVAGSWRSAALRRQIAQRRVTSSPVTSKPVTPSPVTRDPVTRTCPRPAAPAGRPDR